MAVVGNFYFSIFLRLTWKFLGLESKCGSSVYWPNNKIIDVTRFNLGLCKFRPTSTNWVGLGQAYCHILGNWRNCLPTGVANIESLAIRWVFGLKWVVWAEHNFEVSWIDMGCFATIERVRKAHGFTSLGTINPDLCLQTHRYFGY